MHRSNKAAKGYKTRGKENRPEEIREGAYSLFFPCFRDMLRT